MKNTKEELVTYFLGWMGVIILLIYLPRLIESHTWIIILFTLLGFYAIWLVYKGIVLLRKKH